MIKLIKSLLVSLSLIAPFTVSSLAGAQFNPVEISCDNIPDTSQVSDSEVCNEANTTENPITGTEGVLLRVADVIAIVGGIIAVIIMIIAGITMMTSGGDPAKVQNSRNAIIYSLVGAAVIVLARSIVIFIINRTG